MGVECWKYYKMRQYDHIENYINEFNLELLDTPQLQESSFLVLR